MNKKTKIVATLGPATSDKKVILHLRQEGMNVARLNFSHGIHDERRVTIKILRDIERDFHLPTAIIQDLQGPRIRLGNLIEEPIRLERDQKVTLFLGKEQKDDRIPLQPDIFPYLSVGHRILINDGLVKLHVDEVKEHEAKCTVVVSGEIKSHKGVNLPDTELPSMVLTEKDKVDLAFGIEQKVDYVAISFVQTSEDVEYVRDYIAKNSHRPKIIVKLETAAGVKHLEKIIMATDAIMVARGDLAVEIGQEEVPIIQRRIIKLARKYRRPVIVATQMLESMIKNAEPTRAEVNDVATAVLDQADAVMLSAETASGNYPLEAVAMMNKIIKRVEKYQDEQDAIPSQNLLAIAHNQTNAVAAAACVLAEQLNAKKLLALTSLGGTARALASYRSSIPLSVITDNILTYRQLLLSWGVDSYYLPKIEDNEKAFTYLLKQLQEQKEINKDDKVVKVAGAHPGKSGHTNGISVTQLGEE